MAVELPTRKQIRSIVGEHLSEQYDRSQTDADVSQGLDRLHALLVDAARTYETGPQQQRQAVCDAIIATSDYLKEQGFSTNTLYPLTRVIQAITQIVEQNHPDPLFCERPRKAKSNRSLDDANRQGMLAAFAEAWLDAHPEGEGTGSVKLEQAARRLSGTHFGKVTRKMLQSAMSYQRQTGHNKLVYQSYDRMKQNLGAEAETAGGGKVDLRAAITMQIEALNEQAELRLT